MKQLLSEQERTRLDQRITEAERRTGAQIVLAVVGRSDSYAELPWKAFALGAGLAGCAAALFDLLTFTWATSHAALFAVVASLGAGAFLALLCVSWPAFARIFLDKNRAETEARQYAESLFVSRELFATRGRTGLLLVVSMFEREVVLLPDTGLHDRLSREVMEAVIARMTTALAAGEVGRALENGLGELEKILSGAGPAAENELPNAIIEEKGS